MAKYVQLTNPSAEPILTADVKSHLRLETTADDTLIGNTIIPSVRDFAERHCGIVIPQRTFQAAYDSVYKDTFSGDSLGWWDGVRDGSVMTRELVRELELPLPPLVSVQSVKTVGTNDVETTFASTNYYVDTYSEPGKIVLKQGSVWPTDMRHVNAVLVNFTAGYATTPPMLKVAMLQIAAHWYENRELYEVGTILARVPISAMAILDRFKIRKL